ncbi:MAG: TetR/AcrR family transcriptional regulator [Kutzneria sp.]|nr:TetR/AcrR family transcriptional regulator [Kutzneria sp.]
MNDNPAHVRRGGRKRSEAAHAAVLAAALQLLEETGYRAISIEGISERSGVAKSTIYRWWSSKAELVMEAYTHIVTRRAPEPDTGTVEGDLTALLANVYRVARYPQRVRALQGLMAEAQLDPAFRAPFRRWVESRRAVAATILTHGIERGELPADIDLMHAIDLFFGPFWYRLLVGHAPLTPQLAAEHVRGLLDGLRARP